MPRFRPSRFLLSYAVLLAASWGVQWFSPDLPPLPEQRRIALPDHPGVHLACVDAGAGGAVGLPVLLLHGSPARAFDLRALAEELARQRRVIAPDLAGFGRSSRDVTDYGIAAQADLLGSLLDALGTGRVHVVGFSLGGGAAVHLAAARPERVASLTLLSSIGVQELELLGTYTLNRGLHGLQLAGLWLLDKLVPHFGLLDSALFNVPYARSFYDTDQRPLRALMRQLDLPVRIVHGERDVLAPAAAAREHARIIPHSEAVWLPDSHFLAYQRAPDLARGLGDFFQRVEEGGALTRAQADAARAAEAARPFDEVEIPPASGLALVLLVALIALATLVSEDLACIGAGLLAAHGVLTYPWAAFGAFAGIFGGDLLLYAAGRYLGRAALKRAPFRWFIRESALRDSAEWFARRGPMVVLASRFVPGSRLPAFFTAGLLHTRFWIFLLFFLIAGAVWAPLLVGLATLLGERVLEWLAEYKRYTIPVAVVVALAVWVIVELLIPLATYRGRRLLVGRWRRLTQWEYWPLPVMYAPVVLYVLWLGLRHRCSGLFAAANPCIPAGGFLGESKAAILEGLPVAGDGARVARWVRLPASEGGAACARAVREAMAALGLSFPVVAKPDVGQRGLGVAVLRTESALQAHAVRARPAFLVQEHVGGEEFGLFFSRFPGEERGQVFSITAKEFPRVTGDGRHTIEQLILRHPRHVCQAALHLERMHDRLQEIPSAGAVVQLGEIGNHCRGTRFLDGGRWKSEALDHAVTELLRPKGDGLCFGRLDVRAPSSEALREGRGIVVFEINGVTSETTHIYDPSLTLWCAWRTLFAQWRLAFAIGVAQRARGARPLTWRGFFRLLRRYHPADEA